MLKDSVFGCLDIGSSKIACMILSRHDGGLSCLSFREGKSSGLRNGVVVDIDGLSFAVEKVILAAEEEAGVNISNLVINISGKHVESFDEVANVNLEKSQKRIKDYHIKRALHKVQRTKLEETDEMLHMILQEFNVDGQEGVLNPRDMASDKLEINMHLVCGKVNFIKNLVSSIEKAGFGIIDIFIDACFAACAVLAPEEKDLGVCLVDIGAGTTDIIIFLDGQVVFTQILAIGGADITNDMAGQFRLGIEDAEKVKCRHGYVGEFAPGQEAEIVLPDISGKGLNKILSEDLTEVIEPNLDEFLEELSTALTDSEYLEDIQAGIVITGGGALLKGLVPKMKETFEDVPVRLGNVSFETEKSDKPITGPQYAVLCGMMKMFSDGSYDRYNYSLKLGRSEVIREKVKKFFFDIF